MNAIQLKLISLLKHLFVKNKKQKKMIIKYCKEVILQNKLNNLNKKVKKMIYCLKIWMKNKEIISLVKFILN